MRVDESRRRKLQYKGGYGETTETGEKETVVVQEEEKEEDLAAGLASGRRNRAAAEAQQKLSKGKRQAKNSRRYRAVRHSEGKNGRVSTRAGLASSEERRERLVIKVSMAGVTREFEVGGDCTVQGLCRVVERTQRLYGETKGGELQLWQTTGRGRRLDSSDQLVGVGKSL